MPPNTAVWYVPDQVELDLRDEPHLGHPGRAGLLAELYAPGAGRRFEAGVLQCPECRDMNPDCPEWMFLRRGKTGLLHAVHHNPGIRDHDEGESDAHKALKERIATAAQHNGLEAVVESRAADGKRRTDVLVRGGDLDLAFEAQISYASKANVQRRSKRAWKDGLTPLWTTPSLRAPLVDVAPWAGINRMPWDQYRSVHELPVIGGVRGLVQDRCGERGILCPDRKKGRRCPGWHFRWAPQQMSNLDDLVVRAAYGEWIPYDHRTSKNALIWFWVRASDAAQVERDLTPRVPRQRRPADAEVDTRELDGTCTYGQDSGFRTEVLPREEAAIVVAARPTPIPAENPRIVIAPAPTAVLAPESAAQHYRDKVINPGSLPVEGAHEELAAANLRPFVDAVRKRALLERDIRGSGGEVGEPVRDLELDRDGRFGWQLPVNGVEVSILMPGVELARLRDLGAGVPCLQVNGNWAWWNDAVSAAVPLPSRRQRPGH